MHCVTVVFVSVQFYTVGYSFQLRALWCILIKNHLFDVFVLFI